MSGGGNGVGPKNIKEVDGFVFGGAERAGEEVGCSPGSEGKEMKSLACNGLA